MWRWQKGTLHTGGSVDVGTPTHCPCWPQGLCDIPRPAAPHSAPEWPQGQNLLSCTATSSGLGVPWIRLGIIPAASVLGRLHQTTEQLTCLWAEGLFVLEQSESSDRFLAVWQPPATRGVWWVEQVMVICVLAAEDIPVLDCSLDTGQTPNVCPPVFQAVCFYK